MEINFTNKQISKELFNKTLNNQFSQLTLVSQENTGSLFTVEDFFSKYEELFYNIPKDGEQSHTYIIKKSAEYVGIVIGGENDLQPLLDEITSLRSQLLEQTQLIDSLKDLGK